MPTTLEVELPLADSMREFETGKCDRCGLERLEPFCRSQSRFDAKVVLLDNVIQVLPRPDLHVTPPHVLTTQPPERHPARNVAVERDLACETAAVRLQRFAKEGLCGSDSAVTSQ